MQKFEVEFYETPNGDQPAKEFLLSLDKKMRAKMADTISILQDNGYELREPYSKHLSEGIFELRAKVGSDITRVLYFFYVERHIILTNGFRRPRRLRRKKSNVQRNIAQTICAGKGTTNECEI